MIRPASMNTWKTANHLSANYWLLCCVTCLMLAALISGCAAPAHQRIVFHGGDIITMSGGQENVEAVLVEDSKIISVGTKSEVFKNVTRATRDVNLNGNTLMPGFIAVHTHPDLEAYLYGFVDLSGFTHKTPEEVWSALRKAVQEAKPGQWIFCRGFDPMLVPGLRAPDITFLDSIAPNNPVLILAQSMHSSWVNTKAFEKMGITAGTPDPAPGSYYEKDSQGKLTGFVAETVAIGTVAADVPRVFDIKDNVSKVNDVYPTNGITSITTMGLMTSNSFILYEYLATDHPTLMHWALNLIGMLPGKKPAVRHFMYIKPAMPSLIPGNVENGDDFFKVVGIKLWYDGSPYTGSMYLKEPYLVSDLTTKGLGIPPGSRGSSVMKKQEFYDTVKKYHDLGWQVSVHSQGDHSTKEVMNAFEDIQSKSAARNLRHRIEHAVMLSPEMQVKMKQLSMTPSFHINHLYYYGKALKYDILGAKRADTMLPANSSRENGLYISLHADEPMFPEKPLSLLQTAVTRQTRQGETIGAGEALSVMEGLKALTINAAWQLNMETKIGSIEPGKYADLVILDKNPLKAAPQSLGDIQVLNTFVSGREVWKR